MVLKIYKKGNEYFYLLSMCKKENGVAIWTDYFISEKVARGLMANEICKVKDYSKKNED